MSTANPRPSSGAPVAASAGPLPLASWGTRIVSGLLTALFTVMVVGIGVGIGWMSRASGSWHDILAAVVVPGLVAGIIWLLMVLALLAGSAATPGQWVLGVGTVDRSTGRPSGRRAIVKETLLVVLGLLTAGVAPLVLLWWRNPATGENQLDRWAGTLVVQRRGAGVPSEGAGFLAGLLHTQAQPRLEPAQPPVAASPQGARGRLVLDQGATLPLDRSWVLGRNPVPQRSHPGAQPFLVPDLDKTLSKSHVVLVPVPTGVEVTDLYSTNGVSVTLPGGAVQVVGPGRSILAPLGSTITWGARTMEVQAC